MQCLSTHTILQSSRLTEPYSDLCFIFTEAKSENTSEQCNGRTAYENIPVILKLFETSKLLNYFKHGIEMSSKASPLLCPHHQILKEDMF